jgi:cephalosporin hydroxylase
MWNKIKSILRRIYYFSPPHLHVAEEEKINFGLRSVYNGHHKVKYRGIMALRCPFDYVIYQMIICEMHPDLVIEIGTNIGGGALYLADLMNNLGHGMVHTIDIKKQSDELLSHHLRIKLFTEGWENYDLNETKGYEKIMVIEDGSHLYPATLGAMQKFAPVVSIGSYLIVEDGIITALGMEREYQGGPLKAIREFLANHNNFAVDRKWCDLFGKNATFNVNGYLKRVS